MGNSNGFRILLLVQAISISIYTWFAFQAEGPNLFSVFLNSLQSLTWTGQFNLDFSCYLTISGLWIMWRNKFNGLSILLGLAAMVLGIIFFAPYLLWLINREQGDFKRVLVGDR
jgi:hypothetical protein